MADVAETLIALGWIISPFVIGWPLVQGLFVAIHAARHGRRDLGVRSALTILGWLVFSAAMVVFFVVTAMAHCCRTQVTVVLLVTMAAYLAAAVTLSRWQTRWFRLVSPRLRDTEPPQATS